jgi:hypothetical protein
MRRLLSYYKRMDYVFAAHKGAALEISNSLNCN